MATVIAERARRMLDAVQVAEEAPPLDSERVCAAVKTFSDARGQGMDILTRTGSLGEPESSRRRLVDRWFGGHGEGVAGFISLAVLFNPRFSTNLIRSQRYKSLIAGAFVHDIGKVLLPLDSSVWNQRELTAAQKKEISQHTIKGAEILDNYEKITGTMLSPMIHGAVRDHHKRFDGTNRMGEAHTDEFSLGGQLVGWADSVVARSEQRLYYERFYSLPEAVHRVSADFSKYRPGLTEIVQPYIHHVADILTLADESQTSHKTGMKWVIHWGKLVASQE